MPALLTRWMISEGASGVLISQCSLQFKNSLSDFLDYNFELLIAFSVSIPYSSLIRRTASRLQHLGPLMVPGSPIAFEVNCIGFPHVPSVDNGPVPSMVESATPIRSKRKMEE